MFNRYYQTAKTAEKIMAADRKARKEYRVICSALNKILDTTQIKQCNKQWRYINPNNCLLYTSPSPRDRQKSRMPSSA